MKKYKKLIVFDFDGTLCFTPGQIEGEKTWIRETGLPWPYPGSWWGRPETLDLDVFDVPINQWVYQRYLESVADENNYVILATGRLEFKQGMRKNVERILNSHNLSFSGVFLNTGGDTFRFKTRLFEEMMGRMKVNELLMYDDRHEHLIKFNDWAHKQSDSKITICDVVNKKFKTIDK